MEQKRKPEVFYLMTLKYEISGTEVAHESRQCQETP